MTTEIPLSHLFLDPDNYRFRDSEYYEEGRDITKPIVQKRIADIIAGNVDLNKNSEEIIDLLNSFKANGFVPVDKIQVQKIGENVYKVLEGNRRVTSLKHLKEKLDNGDSVGKMESFDFEKIPVELYEDEDPNHFRILMGLKHISGNKKWDAINQSQLIVDLVKSGEDKYDISSSLAISMTALNRYVRTHAFIEEYKKEYKDQFKARMFILFEEVIKSPDWRRFIEWDNENLVSHNKENRDRFFSWISTVELGSGENSDELDEDEGSLANTSGKRPPIIKSQDEVRELKKHLGDSAFLDRMEETQNLKATVDFYKQANDGIAFTDALELVDRGINNAFINLTNNPSEYVDKFQQINNKIQTLGRAFGFIESGVPDSIEFKNELSQSFFLKNISITKYKKIGYAKINNLSKINIFAGGNNSGKSTLAELVYLIAKGADPLGITDIVKIRRKGNSVFNYSWLADYLDTTLPLECDYETTDGKFSHSIISSKINNIESNNLEYGLPLMEITFSVNNEVESCTINQRRLLIKMNTSQKSAVTYVSSQTTFSMLMLEEAWNKVLKGDKKKMVLDFLQKTFSVSVVDIDFSKEHDQGNFLIDTIAGTRSHLFDFGDAFQRCFAIALQAVSAENGFLIIDELENGIHHLNFEMIAKFLHQLQQALGLQIFITTHSLEAIAQFASVIPSENLSFHKLYVRDNKTKVKSYTGEDYKFALEEVGVDLRG